MQPPKRDENIARLTQLFGSHTVRLSDNTSSDPREQKEKKEMSQLINDFTNMRIRQRVHKAKTNIEIDEDLIKWKNDKLVALDGVWKSVEHIYTLITIIQQKIPKNLAPHIPFDSFQAVHIMKQGRTSRMKGQEEQKKVRAFLEARITTLQSIKEKIGKSRQKFEEYKKKCKSTHTALIGIKKVLDFDYAENGNFFKIHNKPVESQNKKKQEKQIIVFYRASNNFPNPSFYRSLVKANITPADDLEFEYSTLEEEKLKDLYDKTFSISLSHRKKDKKKSLASFQFGNIKKKIFEIEFKILNMQLFNYLLQLTSFGKVVPFEFKHSKSDLDIDCKNHLAIELAYRTKEEFHNLGKDSSNIMIYLMLLWVVNNFQYKNVRAIIQETFGFLGNYQRLKKKLAKWKTLFPGFFYVEELNPKNFEVLIEAYFNYNKESSFNICKRISSNPKKVFVILRGSKLFTINPTIGYLTEVTMEQLIEEEFKNKFWVHLNHQP